MCKFAAVHTMGNNRFAYHLLSLLTVAIWGVTFISTKVLILQGLSPSMIFCIRFAVAYAGMWLLCAINGGKDATRLYSGSIRDELIFLFLGITGGSAYFLAENTALAFTQACNVSFIVCSAPLLTVIFTLAARRIIRGELKDGMEDVKINGNLIIGTILALAGMAAVLFDGAKVELSSEGDLLALAAAIMWGLYSIFMGQMASKYGTLISTRKVFFYGLVSILPFMGNESTDWELLAAPEVWGNLLFLSVVASLFCFALWNKTMAVLGNVTATNYVYLNPFFTLVAAVLFLGESMSLQAGLGCAAIVGGVVTACGNWSSPKRKPRQEV